MLWFVVMTMVFFITAWLGAGCNVRDDSSKSPANHGVRDVLGRELDLSGNVDRVICSGAGCLRLLTYLGAHDRIVAVDSIESRVSRLDTRPYAIANPQFKNYPIFGDFRGRDNLELIAGLNPRPQVIFKVTTEHDQSLTKLQQKTGIPVIALDYGNLTHARNSLNRSLRTMGLVMGESSRAEEVITFFDSLQKDLLQRVQDITLCERPSCYVGGVARRGPHGLRSTDPTFASLAFLNADNVAACLPGGKMLAHATIAKEQLVAWNPDVIFVDLSTMLLDGKVNAVKQLRNDPAYRSLDAVRNGRVYGIFPHNLYNRNFETVFANAYYIGSVLYPDRFSDINPMEKAEERAKFLNGGPAFEILRRQLGDLAFSPVPME